MKKRFAGIALSGISALCASAHADVIAYDNAAGVSPLQDYGNSLGLDFNAVSPIVVTQLGVFDNGALANLAGADQTSGVTVQLFQLTSPTAGTAVGPAVSFSPTQAGTQVNGNALQSIAPLSLPAGSYTVVAYNDDNYNSNGAPNSTSTLNTGGAAINFTGKGRNGLGNAFPSNNDGGPSNRYDAGTFAFHAANSNTATIDTTTQGNWIGKYGSQGYILTDYYGGVGMGNTPANPANDAVKLPSYISGYSYSANASGYVWAGTSDMRALQDPNNPSGTRYAATVYNGGDYSVVLDVTQAVTVQVGVYLLDWDSTGRDVTLNFDGESVEVNNTGANNTPLNAYNNGEWVLFNVSLPVGMDPLDIQYNSGANAVISGITFDAVPEPCSAAILAVAGGALLMRRRHCSITVR